MKRIIPVLVGTMLCGILLFLLMVSTAPVSNNKLQEHGKMVKVGVVMVGSRDDGGWSQAHYNGFEAAAAELGNIKLIYCENVAADNDSIVGVIDKLAGQGAQIIFATSFGYGDYLEACSEKHPDIKFFHAAGVKTHNKVATYFGRMYQARYLTGIVAGMQTKTNRIGYVAAYPIPEVIRGIDAFTLGVRSVNPEANVYVQWTRDWTQYDRAKRLTEQLIKEDGVDIVTLHHDTDAPLDVAKEAGIFAIGYNLGRMEHYPDTLLTAAVWNWAPFYVERLRSCFEGRFKGKSYLIGIDDQLLAIAPLNPKVQMKVKEKVDAAQRKMVASSWDVFYGPIWDNQGTLRIAANENIADKELLESIDWFVAGVINRNLADRENGQASAL